MKVYRIRPDSNNVQIIFPEDENNLTNGKLDFDCQPHAEWQSLDMYIYNPKTKPKDFFSLGSSSSVLVFNEKVLDKMLTIFEMAGEILTIKVNDSNFYLLNVLECHNCLNSKSSIWDLYEDGSKGGIIKYSFYSNRLSVSPIFKIPETSSIEILTYTGIKDPEDEFISLYKKYKFSGLKFEEL